MSLSVSELLQLPHRRVVSQGSVVTAETGQVVVLVWLLDLHGDPSTTVRPASMVQGYLHEWLGVCARREQEAPPAPPPPPPSAPPSPLPPTTARSPPPYWLRTYTTGLTSMNSGVGAPLHAIASDGSAAQARHAADTAATDRYAQFISPPPPPSPTAPPPVGLHPPTASPVTYSSTVSGEPLGTEPEDWPCPPRVVGALIIGAEDSTPPSPPAAPPPPPPPSPPYVECSFVQCELISDEEVERLEEEAILEGSRGWSWW